MILYGTAFKLSQIPMQNRLTIQEAPSNIILTDAERNSSLYDLKRYKIPRPFHIREILFETMNDSSGILYLIPGTPIAYSSVTEVLAAIKWPKKYKWDDPDCIRWHFNLKTCKEADIKTLFSEIFTPLYRLTHSSTIKQTVFSIYSELSSALDIYFKDDRDNYPQRNIFFNGRYQQHNHGIKNRGHNARELYQAVINSDEEKTLDLLENGVNPNVFYDYWTPLNAAITMGVDFAKSDYQTLLKNLKIISLLMEFGANPMLKTHDNTAVEICIRRWLLVQWKYADHFIKILEYLTASMSLYPHISVPDDIIHTKVGNVIARSNGFLIDLFMKPHKYPKICSLVNQDTNLLFHMSDGVKISVITLSGDCLKQDIVLQNDLFDLFKIAFDWKKVSTHFKNSTTEFRNYFQNLIPNSDGVIDCIYIDTTLVGMNIAEITTKIYDTSVITEHYIKLAVATDKLRNYKRFMSVISYARGFALQKEQPDTPVLTWFEAADVSSYLQICDLDMFPKIRTLEKLMETIVDNRYLPTELSWERGLHIKDKLAMAKISHSPHSFWTDNELSRNGFENRYQLNQHSVIAGFINHDDNLKRLAKKINPHCDGINFNQIIDYYANTNSDSFTLAKL